MSRREESGAIAVVVALLALVLIGMAAFVADFGLAYANKRQIQTAADATVLSVAGKISLTPGDCSAVAGADPGRSSAQTSMVDTNDMSQLPATLGSDYAVRCVDGVPTVSTSVTSNAPRVFGGLFGSGNYALTRSAAAVVEVPTSIGSGLRPLAICSADVPTGATYPTPVLRMNGPGIGARPPLACPESDRSGNWWSLDCPDGPNGEPAGGGPLADAIRDGCLWPVSVVPAQPPLGPLLAPDLIAKCLTESAHCLSADTGNLRGAVPDRFQELVNSGETIYLPVFCGKPDCVPAAIPLAGGTGARYPVYKFIGVQVCGFHFGPKNSTRANMTGDCANNPTNFDPGSGTPTDNYLLLSIKQVQVSGSTTPSGCKVGAPCDTGLRQVRMVAGPYTE